VYKNVFIGIVTAQRNKNISETTILRKQTKPLQLSDVNEKEPEARVYTFMYHDSDGNGPA
jgi:hypothetical protein